MIASIIISSYNYARYLPVAIDSALAQSHLNLEVIVVDDGSTDSSREVIASYGDRIKPLLKANGGQASAFNAGFAASRGEVIIFLDSDDMLEPDTVEKAMRLFADPSVAKVHWNLWIADSDGVVAGNVVRASLSEGDLKGAVLEGGPDAYTWPPTSGNAWARHFLEAALPIPSREFNTCPDLYLATLAPLYGLVKSIPEPQGFWRHHPVNASFSDEFSVNLAEGLGRAEKCLNCLDQHARTLGLTPSPELRRNSRWHQMKEAVECIEKIVLAGEPMILVDEDHWKTGVPFLGRRLFHFPEQNGQFWGSPADDDAAIRELDRLRGEGAKFIVFVWPYLWWLDHYAGFTSYLREHFPALIENDRIAIFDLRAR